MCNDACREADAAMVEQAAVTPELFSLTAACDILTAATRCQTREEMLEQVLQAVGFGFFEPIIDGQHPRDECTAAATAEMVAWAAGAARQLIALSRCLYEGDAA